MRNLSYSEAARRSLFAVAGLIASIYVLVTLVTFNFDPESLVFVGPMIVIPAIIGLVLRRWGGWTYLLAVLGGLALVVFSDAAKGLSNPTSTIEFVFTAVVFIGGVIALITGFLALLRRNSDPPAKLNPILAYTFVGIIGMAIAVSLVGAIGWAVGGSEISDTDRAAADAVGIENFQFTPESLAAGSDRLVVSNSDLFHHTFTIEELNIDVSLNPGREELVDISDVAAGEYDVICAVPGHEAMKSKLVINR